MIFVLYSATSFAADQDTREKEIYMVALSANCFYSRNTLVLVRWLDRG